jgi:hypothetical protein
MVMRFQKRLLLFILLGVLVLAVNGCTPENLGQTQTATVYLQILNPNGQIYSISMYNEDSGEYKNIEEKTDRDGFLVITDVIPGFYTIYAYDQILFGEWYGIEYYVILEDENYIEMTVKEDKFY